MSVLDEGYSMSVPDEGYSMSVPDEGYSMSWKQHRTQTIYCHVYMNVSIIVITFYLPFSSTSNNDNPEKPATQVTQDEDKKNPQHNMCWTPLCASKHKSRK